VAGDFGKWTSGFIGSTNLAEGDTIGEELNPRHALLTSVWEIPPERDQRHPNPFPIELPTRCIFSVLDGRKGVVLDPYCGIGTTLVAAKLLGCDYLGIDISETYVAIACERLQNAEAERARVAAELSLHVVRKTFKERKERGEWVGRFRPKPLANGDLEQIAKQVALPMQDE